MDTYYTQRWLSKLAQRGKKRTGNPSEDMTHLYISLVTGHSFPCPQSMCSTENVQSVIFKSTRRELAT